MGVNNTHRQTPDGGPGGNVPRTVPMPAETPGGQDVSIERIHKDSVHTSLAQQQADGLRA